MNRVSLAEMCVSVCIYLDAGMQVRLGCNSNIAPLRALYMTLFGIFVFAEATTKPLNYFEPLLFVSLSDLDYTHL